MKIRSLSWLLSIVLCGLLVVCGFAPASASMLPLAAAQQGTFATHVSDYRALGVSGSVTVKGYFVNITGTRVGSSFSGTALQGDGVNAPRSLATIAGVDLPTGASAVVITSLSGSIYLDRAPVPSGTDDFKTNYANYEVRTASQCPFPLGRMAADTSPVTGTLTTSAAATENFLGFVGGTILTPSSTFTRPADTTAYASGDLVANSTTAGSVTPLSWTSTRVAAGSGMIRKAQLFASNTSITNASFTLDIFSASPTVANGDNGAWSSTLTAYLGSIDITLDKAGTDGAIGNGSPNTGSEINFKLASGSTLYGTLRAKAAYTPTSAGTFRVTLEILAN